ncbi:PH domain-containing protein [Sphingomonas sp. Leaf22]|uniref:PH domain-containing protein n=2 Tax=Sphingomonas TaxID=13687 RepID=UPI0009E72A48|nr:PH domain-containing protein [Sphingomonas sp. Leaf22]
MDPMPLSLAPLDRRFVTVLRWRAAVVALVVLLLAGVGEAILYGQDLPNGIAAGLAVLIAIWLVAIAPPRRFAHWGFALDERELHIGHGWLTRVHTIVPIGRVQHIDLTQGPIERGCSVATLVLHTAGTDHSRVTVPGLARDQAEAVRDRIRGAIEASPW